MKEIILEKIINKLIADKVIDFSNLNSKTIVITLNDINLNFCFFVNDNKVFIFDEVKPSDATIEIGFSAFKDLLNKKDLTDLIREDKVVITGELKTAQLLVDLLKNNNLKSNIEELLPDDAILFAKKLKAKIKSNIFNNEFKDKIVETLIQPKVYK
jgi:ubiquinone biosynthesis protein UbiJ